AQAERLQHEAGLQRRGGAGRTGRYSDVVDAHQQALTLDVDEAHVQVAGQMVFHVAVHLRVVQRVLELLAQIVAELNLALGFRLHLFAASPRTWLDPRRNPPTRSRRSYSLTAPFRP